MRKLLIFLFSTLILYAQGTDIIDVFDNETKTENSAVIKDVLDINTTQKEKIIDIQSRLKAIEDELSRNIWTKKYSNYITYHFLEKELIKTEREIKVAKRKKSANLSELENKKETLLNQLELLKEYKESPFIELLKPEEIPEPPEVKNPVAIIAAISYIKQINEKKEYYRQKLAELKSVLNKLKEKEALLKEIYELEKSEEIRKKLSYTIEEVTAFSNAVMIAEKTIGVYEKRIEEVVLKVTEEIKVQSEKAAAIMGLVLVLFGFNLFIKWIAKRYVKDNERFYMINKIINFSFATVIILIVLFAYIENVTYIVTILGFASAGIAIAMKDWFMSLLGWIVIVFGGTIHVGDRIKVKRNGLVYVGDVVDISLLRITILEDITLTTYHENRRAGRVIFVPNNYIFTDLIANYTHGGLKTVWDGIDINITFDSNHKKAMHIAREITRKYAKGYTDITRKQLNRLRSSYHLKNTNVEPRVYSFIEDYGIRISVWYLTNSYATLTLRSTISGEIIDRFNREEDIKIALPSQSIYLTKGKFNNINSENLSEG
ncbi:mechanosensitive ion channel domain-containing protein [Nitrosophilus alvini]|uniref:mechanosensitive ion channel domain-containing protein n=1 Tax=Nitrosophilus alvini TaxID=2714855 RepID=UPI001F194E6E|nr:mechanosensitive ion channel domain-containing protein [Nitrosophilus alvini]